MVPFLSALDAFFWGPGTLALLVGTGVFLTLRTHFLPLRDLGWAIRTALGRDARQQKSSGGISPFSALMTALAATVGTGNIVGVATALTAGGPGALVWMELAALAGLSTKFAECLLAVKYRARSHQGGYRGGPMYVLHRRLGLRRLGAVYALFTLLASFGIGGMVQSNAIAQALETSFAVPAPAAGAATAILALLVLLRGGRAVASVSAALVPGMALVYLSAGTAVIAGHLDRLPEALGTMLRCAFSPGAVAGGGLGAAVSALDAARWGVARGVFSNESGLGSAAISAAAAATHSPVRQGYISMTSTFFDTCLVCTVTGLAICCFWCAGAGGRRRPHPAGLPLRAGPDRRGAGEPFHRPLRLLLHPGLGVPGRDGGRLPAGREVRPPLSSAAGGSGGLGRGTAYRGGLFALRPGQRPDVPAKPLLPSLPFRRGSPGRPGLSAPHPAKKAEIFRNDVAFSMENDMISPVQKFEAKDLIP